MLYVSSGSSLSSHSRQTQPGSRAMCVLSSAGTIVTPQKAQIGGRSSSGLPSTASTIREGFGETIGATRRHSSSSSASSLSHVLLAAIRAQRALGAEVAALERTLVHRDTRIDGLVHLGASDHELGQRDSPPEGGASLRPRAERLALGRAPARAGRARSGRRSTCSCVDRGRGRLLSRDDCAPRLPAGSITTHNPLPFRPSLLSAGLRAAGLVRLVVPLACALG